MNALAEVLDRQHFFGHRGGANTAIDNIDFLCPAKQPEGSKMKTEGTGRSRKRQSLSPSTIGQALGKPMLQFVTAERMARTDLEGLVRACEYAAGMFSDPWQLALYRRADKGAQAINHHGKRHHQSATGQGESVVIQVDRLRPGTFTPLDSLKVRLGLGNHDTGMMYGKDKHAPKGASNTKRRFRRRGFPEDIIHDACFIIRHHRTDDYLRVRLENIDPALLRMLAAAVMGDKTVECWERVREEVRKHLLEVFKRKPADFVGSVYAWLSQWQREIAFRLLRFYVEGNEHEEVDAFDVAGLGCPEEPHVVFSDPGRADGKLLCEVTHRLNSGIVTASEFMALFGYRFVGLHYAALDLNSVFVARFDCIKEGEADGTLLFTYDEVSGGWLPLSEGNRDQDAA